MQHETLTIPVHHGEYESPCLCVSVAGRVRGTSCEQQEDDLASVAPRHCEGQERPPDLVMALTKTLLHHGIYYKLILIGR